MALRHRLCASATQRTLKVTATAAKAVVWTTYWSVVMPCIVLVLVTTRNSEEPSWT